jgi:hypothetical protein
MAYIAHPERSTDKRKDVLTPETVLSVKRPTRADSQ